MNLLYRLRWWLRLLWAARHDDYISDDTLSRLRGLDGTIDR